MRRSIPVVQHQHSLQEDAFKRQLLRILLHSKLELPDSAVFFVVLHSRDARSAVVRASLRECRVDRLAKRGARIWWHAAFGQRDLAVLAEEHKRGQPADAIGLRKVIALHL